MESVESISIHGGSEPEQSSLVERLFAGFAATGLVSGSIAVACFNPTKANFFPVCPLYSLTGLACPGCGLTRGFHALFHGDVITALDFNMLLPIWAVIIAYVFVSLILLAVRGRGLPMWPSYPKFLWGFMITLVAFGVLRNIPVWPLTILFP